MAHRAWKRFLDGATMQALRRLNAWAEKHPRTSASAAGVILGGSGDLMAQRIEANDVELETAGAVLGSEPPSTAVRWVEEAVNGHGSSEDRGSAVDALARPATPMPPSARTTAEAAAPYTPDMFRLALVSTYCGSAA